MALALGKSVAFVAGASQSEGQSSPFRRALDEYLGRKSKKSKTPAFLNDLQVTGSIQTKHDVQKAMIELEKTSTDKTSAQVARKVLKPVIRVLADYTSIVDTLAQADPMPTAIIWGCLKAVVDSSKRFLGLYETIKQQLDRLERYLECLTEYEELFGNSANMQKILEDSYINVIRFWCRVEKECSRCIANRLGRAFASFSTSKLDSIIKSIDLNASDCGKLVPVVQERLQRGEREDAAEERRSAGIAREEQSAFIKQQQEERRLQMKRTRQKDVREWLRGRSNALNESNDRHHDQCVRQRNPHTCSWLSSHELFQSWLDPSSNTSKIWLQAARGVGKSVVCAYAIEQALKLSSHCSVRQYYTFDEEFSAIQVYRSLAEQLADQIWTQLDDMPREVHDYTQRSATSSKSEDVKMVIRLLIDAVPTTYVFLDGLDEESDKKERWNELDEVLNFFNELNTTDSSRLRLWCSSQDRTKLKKKLNLFETIEINKDLNHQDIKACLADRISGLESQEIDPDYRTLILNDLQEKAAGRFLWASLMLDLIASASTLQGVQQVIEQGLPDDYERYYHRKIESLDAPQKRFVSIILACIVYAKRPLRLDELCEATAVLSTDGRKNADRSEKIFKSRIPNLCEPLIQIQNVRSGQRTVATCTLTHSSVYTYLLSNPQVLSATPGIGACPIESQVLANVCLNYLSQPRYSRLLRKSAETFIDSDNEDIMEHHLLSYAAKYWDKHLDDTPFSQEMSDKAESFINSPHFRTCLQVQSLFIEGKFQFWYSSSKVWQIPSFRRTFPLWLSQGQGQKSYKDYYDFVGEWGHVLNEVTSFRGKYAGEIDRCFWGALGEQSFLRKAPQSRFKSFMLRGEELSLSDNALSRCYDTINASGDHLAIVRLSISDDAATDLSFRCELWDLTRRRPRLQKSQEIIVPYLKWALYDSPTSKKCPGRPVPVSLTSDLQFLRIGSSVFTWSEDSIYRPINIFEEEDDYFEDMASCERYLAVSTRQQVLQEDLITTLGSSTALHEEAVARFMEDIIEAESKASSSTKPTTERGSSATQSTKTASSSNTSVISSDSDTEKSENIKKEDTQVESANIEDTLETWEVASSTESVANSAETSWSEGSTNVSSDEFEDDDQWNDWSDERLMFEEFQEQVDDEEQHSSDDDRPEDGSRVVSRTESEVSSLSDPSDIGSLGLRLRAVRVNDDDDEEEAKSASSILSHYSQSLYSTSGDEEHSDYEHEGRMLDNLLFGNQKAGKHGGAHRISVRIYDTMNKEQKPIFHYSHYVDRNLFSSPPVFHPSKPLLVWPLGAGEVLFANYMGNTYFTRLLCSSGFGSCQVFVKPHFSSNGEYLHFAALEAQNAEKSEDSDEKSPAHVLLTLQVSTHRLSTRKTVSSPPHLIFRTNVFLGKTESVSVSALPYTLTWMDQILYFVKRDTKLNVIRIPLFRPAKAGNQTVIYCPRNDIYLPRTATLRDVHYHPPLEGAKKGMEGLGTVIIGSYSSRPAQGMLVPRHAVSPPIGVYLSEQHDLGGWMCKADVVDAKQRHNATCGRLQGKFEHFDRKEDCDCRIIQTL